MSQNLWPWNNPAGLREAAQPNVAYTTDSATANTTLAADVLTGGFVEVDLNLDGVLTAAATATTDTAANIVAAVPLAQRYAGFSYKLRILNTSTGDFAWTVAAGTGVTITGTKTIAQNTWREFVVTLTNVGTPAVTLQSVGTGTYS